MFTLDELDNILSLIDFREEYIRTFTEENWGFDVESLRDRVLDAIEYANND